MNFDKIKIGNKVPNDVNVIIEIPMHSDPVKYEIDHDSGAVFVDRFIHTAMHYPCNYGFIPHTLSNDGDPLDVLVITKYPLFISSVINVKPIGVLMMEDEKGQDEKIIAVPVPKLHKSYESINDITDIPQTSLDEIVHFFERYKDLESGKWVKVSGFKDHQVAKEIIINAVNKANGK